MAPTTDTTSTVPLLSRRRGSLANTDVSSHDVANAGSDLEQGGGGGGTGVGGANDSTINVRVKTAGDGREYKVAASLTATIAEVG